MLRIGFGIAIVTAIYLNSPQRPADDLSKQAAAWIEQAKVQLVTGAAGAGAASLLEGAVLRRSFDQVAEPDRATEPSRRPLRPLAPAGREAYMRAVD